MALLVSDLFVWTWCVPCLSHNFLSVLGTQLFFAMFLLKFVQLLNRRAVVVARVFPSPHVSKHNQTKSSMMVNVANPLHPSYISKLACVCLSLGGAFLTCTRVRGWVVHLASTNGAKLSLSFLIVDDPTGIFQGRV